MGIKDSEKEHLDEFLMGIKDSEKVNFRWELKIQKHNIQIRS